MPTLGELNDGYDRLNLFSYTQGLDKAGHGGQKRFCLTSASAGAPRMGRHVQTSDA